MKEKIYLWDSVSHCGLRRCLHGLQCAQCSVDGSDGVGSGGPTSLSSCSSSSFPLSWMLVDNYPWIVLDCMQRMGVGRSTKYIMRWSVKAIWLWWEHVISGSNFVLI